MKQYTREQYIKWLLKGLGGLLRLLNDSIDTEPLLDNTIVGDIRFCTIELTNIQNRVLGLPIKYNEVTPSWPRT